MHSAKSFHAATRISDTESWPHSLNKMPSLTHVTLQSEFKADDLSKGYVVQPRTLKFGVFLGAAYTTLQSFNHLVKTILIPQMTIFFKVYFDLPNNLLELLLFDCIHDAVVD